MPLHRTIATIHPSSTLTAAGTNAAPGTATSIRMGRQHVYNYPPSDSEPESALQPLRRHHHHRRRRNRSKTPALQTAAPSPQSSSSTSSGSNKKSQKPPQESIDSIWDKFSQKKFTKALAILPFSPVQASTSGQRGNELLQAGYERAADECRRKVRKIITECKRVNTRYRDPGWDLDWDIKWEKGHTLNSLTKQMFDISRANLCNPESNVPKAVKRVHEIFEKPTFMENILPGDVKQGQLGDCWFVGSLTALANVPGGFKRICVEHDTKIGIYGFVFYRDGEWIYSIIDDKLFLKSPCWDSPSMQRDLLQLIDREDVERVYRQTYQTGSQALYFAQNKDEHETWVPLVEKAYAKAHGDYVSLAGGWIGEALEDLSGGVTTELLASDILDIDAFWTNELSKVNHEFLFGCSTGLIDGGYGARDGITEGHAYVIMDAKELKDGTRLCKLRNPWGKVRKGNWEGAWSDGSKEWTTEAQEELNHTFGSDSTFWIPYEDMLRKYLHFDRTRLFRDPDWRSCQRWIGVDVPWKPQYNEKFHLTLTRESPVVLVLAQLDDRYFRGLQGQYSFRLQFRVHAEGAPGAEEYIVRSHGNYLMDRSVSIELPALGAGSYAVYMSISGERDTGLASTEAVVLRECAGREDNEKLAQVGQAYDFAHSKAAAHLDRLLKVRTKAEGKKASEARRKERRKEWEKRQIQRAIADAQKVKDEAKKAEGKRCKRAKAKDEAEAKAKAEAEAKGKADAKAKVKADAEAKEAAEKEAQGKADQPEPKSSDKAAQADSDLTRGESQVAVDADSASTTSTSSSSTDDPQDTPQDSPELKTSTPVKDQTSKIDVPSAEPLATMSSADAAPPPPSLPINVHKALELKLHYCSCSTCKPPPAVEDSDGYSSDSPVEDYEDFYDSDDMRTSIRAPAPTPPTESDDSDDGDAPDPWNAIAVVGFRVYSKDEGLELRVVLEGGELEQHGMGNLGEADLDNAVTNAAGQREKKMEEEGEKIVESGVGDEDGETDAEEAGEALPEVEVHARGGGADVETKSASQQGEGTAAKAAYRTIIERKTSEFDRVVGKAKDGKSEQDAPADNSAVAEAPTKASTPAQQHDSADEQPAQTRTSAVKDVPNTPQPPTTTVPARLEKPAGNTTKEVLSIRARLQSACRNMLAAPTHHQPPGEDAMQAMSDALGKLESLPDLEAGVILGTRIHKVMVAILKLCCLPPTGGEELVFSIVARAQSLLDDYELTLMTSEDAGRGSW